MEIKTIAMIGLGAMGRPIAKNLLHTKLPLVVYDTSSVAMEALEKCGATICASPAETAAQADLLLLSLPNEAIVRSTLEIALCAAFAPLRAVIDLSSISPEAAREFAQMTRTRDILYIDCPVSGGVAGAEKGTLTLMAGAAEKELSPFLPILETIGGKIYPLGAAGNGSAMKMVNNYLLACNMAAAAEALALGRRAGLEISAMQEIISVSSGRSFVMENKVPNFIEKGSYAPGFAIDLQLKDLSIARACAQSERMPLFMGASAAELFQAARAAGFDREDISAVFKVCNTWGGTGK